MINIVVTGNIASGKSTICKKLMSHFSDATLLSLDEERISAYKRGFDGFELERIAENNLLSIPLSKLVIYESTGTTKFYQRVIREKLRYPLIKIHIQTNPENCEQRFKERKRNHFQVAPPYNRFTVKQSIIRNHRAYLNMVFDYQIENNSSFIKLEEQIEILIASLKKACPI